MGSMIIFGKGPTATPEKALILLKEARQLDIPVVTINQASSFLVDKFPVKSYLVFCDFEVWCSIPEAAKFNGDTTIVCPSVLHLDEVKWMPVEEVTKFDIGLKRAKEQGRLLHSPIPENPSCTSTLEFFIRSFASYLDIHKIKTMGIDGGLKRAKEFEDCYRPKPVSYNTGYNRLKQVLAELNIIWKRELGGEPVSETRKKRRFKDKQKQKAKLMNVAKERLNQNGAPDFGFKEGDLIRMNNTLGQLIQSHNIVAKTIDEWIKFELIDKTQQNGHMLTTLLEMVADNGKAISALCTALNERGVLSEEYFKKIDAFIATDEKLKELSLKTQQRDTDSTDNQGPAEKGDRILINYLLFDESDKILTQETRDMGYEIGAPGLPSNVSEGLEGMVKGETRMFDDVVFDEGAIEKEYVGKRLKMQILCKDVKLKKTLGT